MLYATGELYLPSGELLRQQVVETCDGVVLTFSSFLCENHSVLYVPVIHLFGRLPFGADAVAGNCATDVLYACPRRADGAWEVLE